jgi:hypothetical protein
MEQLLEVGELEGKLGAELDSLNFLSKEILPFYSISYIL